MGSPSPNARDIFVIVCLRQQAGFGDQVPNLQSKPHFLISECQHCTKTDAWLLGQCCGNLAAVLTERGLHACCGTHATGSPALA